MSRNFSESVNQIFINLTNQHAIQNEFAWGKRLTISSSRGGILAQVEALSGEGEEESAIAFLVGEVATTNSHIILWPAMI